MYIVAIYPFRLLRNEWFKNASVHCIDTVCFEQVRKYNNAEYVLVVPACVKPNLSYSNIIVLSPQFNNYFKIVESTQLFLNWHVIKQDILCACFTFPPPLKEKHKNSQQLLHIKIQKIVGYFIWKQFKAKQQLGSMVQSIINPYEIR